MAKAISEPNSKRHGTYLGPEEAPDETPDDQEGASTLPLRKRVAGKPEQHWNNSNFRSGYKRVKSDLTPMQVGADDADDGVYPDRAHDYPDNTRVGNKRNPSSAGTYPLPASEGGGARERAGGTGQNGRRPVRRRVSPYPVKPDKTP